MRATGMSAGMPERYRPLAIIGAAALLTFVVLALRAVTGADWLYFVALALLVVLLVAWVAWDYGRSWPLVAALILGTSVLAFGVARLAS
ncbi:MAG: hypothetical protein JW940_18740 [Polyangiaceae bacterium]|nr:hypothetical protein [Polyangiaceae bacterium]